MKQFSNKGVRTSEATLGGFSSRMLLGMAFTSSSLQTDVICAHDT
jgi:hypothetical protein